MSTPGTTPLSAGWYPDPAGSGGQRWHDGQGWTGQVLRATASPRRVLDQGFARLADWLGRVLAAWGVLYLLLGLLMLVLWAGGQQLFAPTGTDAADPTAGPDPAPGNTGGVALAVDLVFFSLWLLTVVMWLVWQYRLAASAPGRLRNSPEGHVGWWFVPFASMVVPRRAIGDLWHAYELRRPGDPSEPTPWVFSVWWALWLAPSLLIPILVISLLNAETPDGAVSAVLGASTLMTLAQAGAALTARLVVRALSWRALVFHSAAR